MIGDAHQASDRIVFGSTRSRFGGAHPNRQQQRDKEPIALINFGPITIQCFIKVCESSIILPLEAPSKRSQPYHLELKLLFALCLL